MRLLGRPSRWTLGAQENRTIARESMKASNLDRLANAGLVTAALALAVVAVWRQLSPPVSSLEEPPIVHDPNWRSYLGAGEPDGSLSAPLTVIEFSDFECPFCRLLHEALRGAEQRLGDSLTTVFVHYPLPQHRQASPAAKAAECARAQGRFSDFLNTAFASQDSLGVAPWSALALSSGVTDSARFAACMDGVGAFPGIDSGKVLGARLALTATPTMFINGWRIRGSVDSATMQQMFLDILAGKTPRR